MPIPRRSKGDHLLHADVVDSKSKAGVWMGEQANFKADQANISEALKERTDWVDLENAVLVISTDPAGITVIAPNPTLPGMIVLADGGSPLASQILRDKGVELVRTTMAQLGIAEVEAA